jgi:hypothetical protein
MLVGGGRVGRYRGPRVKPRARPFASPHQGGLVAALPSEHRQQTGFLQDRLVGLAGTPDDDSRIGADLVSIMQLAADRISAVDHASLTSQYQGGFATVGATSGLAAAVDEAQYHGEGGPCLEALANGSPIAVPEIGATIVWPQFRDTAGKFGLSASLSIPLFAGSGRTVAALNLYGRERDAMRPLSQAVLAAYHPDPTVVWNHESLDLGGRELAGGLIGAVALRNMIRRAIVAIMSATGQTPDFGYLTLRLQAAAAGDSLSDTAAYVIEHKAPNTIR